ncbi:MAG: amylo-alpha-1,6-glucosidase [Planctomycetota bacterium]
MPAARPSAPSESSPRSTSLPGDAEWLLTDGRGGYACGTAAALATRRYHGLWVVRPEGSARRHMVVADLDERIGPPRRVGDDGAPRMAHVMHAHWRDQPVPTPPEADVTFARWPLPTWTFRTELGVFERSVALRRQDGDRPPLLLVRWRNLSELPVRVEVRPLLGWCDVDHLPPIDESFDATVHARGASWGFRPNDSLPHLWLTVDGVAGFGAQPHWYRGFLYAMDGLRGYDHVGDRWNPGVLELDLAAGGEAVAAFALGEPCAAASDAFAIELQRAEAMAQTVAEDEHPLAARLELGADDFLYHGVGGRLGVLAGFPWFGEWGRDVFLALPGLTLARGRVDLCEQVLTGCLPFLHEGLLPNIYGEDVTDSDYGSCDAALWYALAVMRYRDAGGDQRLLQQRLVPALRSIAEAYRRGTHLGLVVGDDDLLRAGGEHLNATWMDAQTSQGPVTPRQGLPVEIQALWYALLAFLAEVDDADGSFAAQRDRCGKAFVAAFWLKDGRYLADRVHDGVPDRAVRPNMLVAAALSRSPLRNVQRQGVVDKANELLLTPCGLRTLAPDEPSYVGVYGGGLEGRDRAYHQGTVWPWPAGFYVEACLRGAARRSRKKVATELLQWLEQLLARELDRAGIDHVSEVFDGDPPHRPGGTFAQAWNTGELLRAHELCRAVLAGRSTELS